MNDCIPQQKTDYHLEQLDGELLLYHPNQTVIMYCNPTASLIWQLCTGQHTVQDISTLLSTAYEQPENSVALQVEATLQQFYQHQAISYLGDNQPEVAQESR